MLEMRLAGDEGNQNVCRDDFGWVMKAGMIWATGKVRQFTGMGEQETGKGGANTGGVRWSVGRNWIERMGPEEGSRRAEWWNYAEFNGGRGKMAWIWMVAETKRRTWVIVGKGDEDGFAR